MISTLIGVLWIPLFIVALVYAVGNMWHKAAGQVKAKEYAELQERIRKQDLELGLSPEGKMLAVDRTIANIDAELQKEWIKQWHEDPERTEDRLERVGLPRSWAYAAEIASTYRVPPVIWASISDPVTRIVSHGGCTTAEPVEVIDNVTGRIEHFPQRPLGTNESFCIHCGKYFNPFNRHEIAEHVHTLGAGAAGNGPLRPPPKPADSRQAVTSQFPRPQMSRQKY
jgi:hypothetical protein